MDLEARTRRGFLAGVAAAAGGVALGGVLPASAAPLPPVPRRSRTREADPTGNLVDHLRQWVLGDQTDEHLVRGRVPSGIAPGVGFSMRNVRLDRLLDLEHQTLGICLGWAGEVAPTVATSAARWFFGRRGVRPVPVTYGEALALGYGSIPTFVRHDPRGAGVALQWSADPLYEWSVLGGEGGTPVRWGERVALFNHAVGDCLVHVDRAVGADLGWPGAVRPPDRLPDVVVGAVPDHWAAAVDALRRT